MLLERYGVIKVGRFICDKSCLREWVLVYDLFRF